MPRYDAFISYSHAADGALAPAVQRGLHALAKPWYRLRAVHVFRDETSLSANPALWTAIERALSGSRWFVYLASPRAAASPWAQREVRWWLANRDAASMMIAVTDGAIRWDPAANGFDPTATDVIPPELMTRFPGEPLWVDLRFARGLENLSLRHSRFRSAILKLAAPLHGRSPEDLDGADVRTHRRARRIAVAAVAALAVLAIAATTAAWIAVRRSRESSSRELAAYATQQLEADPELSLRLALHAVERAGTPQGEDALRSALAESKVRWSLRGLSEVVEARFSSRGDVAAATGHDVVVLVRPGDTRLLRHPALVASVRFTPDAASVATGCWDGKARVWDVATGALRFTTPQLGKRIDRVEVDASGKLLLTIASSLPERDSTRACVWDLATGALVAELPGAGSIVSARFDGSGTRVVTGDFRGDVRLWDARAGRTLRELRGHRGAVDAVAFAPDDGRVVTVSVDLTVRSWDAQDGAARSTGGQVSVPQVRDLSERRVGLSASTRRAAIFTGGHATIYDAHTGAVVQHLAEVPGSVTLVVFSHDDRFIACGDRSGLVTVWDVASGQTVARLRGHKGDIDVAEFSADDAVLMTGGSDGTLRLWAVETGTRDVVLSGHERDVTTATWSPDGRLIATGGSDGVAAIWDARTGRAVWRLTSPGRVASLAFSSDGERLLVGRYDDGGLEVWSTKTGALVATLGRALATGEATAAIPSVHEHASWGPGDVLAISWAEGALRRWDASSGRPLPPLRGEPVSEAGPALCGFSRASMRACVSAGAASSRIVDVSTGAPISTIEGHVAPVNEAALSPDGRRAAFAGFGDDGVVDVWETTPPRRVCQFRSMAYVNALRFDRDSLRIATGGGEPRPVVAVWDAKTCRRLLELPGHTHAVESAEFSPDGRLLVTAGQDETARVWDVGEGRAVAVLRGHRDMIFGAEFSPDGRRVLTAAADATARVYDVSLARPLPELVELARKRKPRPLSVDEARVFIH